MRYILSKNSEVVIQSDENEGFEVEYNGSQITKQTADLMVKHSKQTAWWQHSKTKEMYILVGVNINRKEVK